MDKKTSPKVKIAAKAVSEPKTPKPAQKVAGADLSPAGEGKKGNKKSKK